MLSFRIVDIIYTCILSQYEDNEEVVLWMNTVGPYHNRQETYSYFSLPFCAGNKKGKYSTLVSRSFTLDSELELMSTGIYFLAISHYHETLAEAIQGVELEFSGLDIDFKGKP